MSILNNDILLLISEHIDVQEDRINLLLVCREWYSLFLPKVYHSVRLEREKYFPSSVQFKQIPELDPPFASYRLNGAVAITRSNMQALR